jgi:hypothetical protein
MSEPTPLPLLALRRAAWAIGNQRSHRRPARPGRLCRGGIRLATTDRNAYVWGALRREWALAVPPRIDHSMPLYGAGP